MKKKITLLVVMPLGPQCRPGYIVDTINSIRHYTRGSHHILLADDSQKGTGARVQTLLPDVEVLTTGEPMGKLCGLYITLSLAFRHALQHYHFDALLRIDTDALVIGKTPERAPIELFRQQPGVGMAGQYPLDYEGQPWDISWPQEQFHKYTRTLRFFKHPRAHARLTYLYWSARMRGYRTGESVFGGACFFSEACLRRLLQLGLLPYMPFRNVNLEEDHLFSLLVKAAGFGLGDLSTNGPVACAWKGLPASPEELWERDRKIIHSTRFWRDRDEDDIRDFFRARREAAGEPAATTRAAKQ